MNIRSFPSSNKKSKMSFGSCKYLMIIIIKIIISHPLHTEIRIFGYCSKCRNSFILPQGAIESSSGSRIFVGGANPRGGGGGYDFIKISRKLRGIENNLVARGDEKSDLK